MSDHDRERWDKKYRERQLPNDVVADDWLMRHAAQRPAGRAIDLACGLGHNAIWLAQRGWQVDAVDISPVGLQLAAEFAKRHHADVNFICADLEASLIESDPEMTSAYDLVLVFRFLDREHLPGLIPQLLKPDGVLIYETFTRSQLQREDSHIQDERFTLTPGELPRLYAELKVIAYEEVELADRNVARLCARR